ncbi:MAG: tetratricopeptide repeat protein [Leptolyngbya sp.]|nr:tetratricopeptide repeat protein [Candidatus Melainabacteria bacterium]
MESLRTRHVFEPVPPKERRGKGRLIFGLVAAVGLVTLPVLPLTYFGGPGPAFDEWQQKLFGIMKAPSPVKGVSPAKTPVVVRDKMDNVKLLDGAAQQLLQALEIDPENPELHNQVGLIYAEIGDYESAITHFRKVVSVARGMIVEKANESQRLRDRGDIKGATNAILASSKVNVELSAAHGNLARVFESLGQHDKVVAQLDELKHDISVNADMSKMTRSAKLASAGAALGQVSRVRMTPETLATLARAQALMHSNRVSEAVSEYKAVLVKDPDVAIAHQQLGLVAASEGNLFASKQELAEAVRLDAADAQSHTALAVTYSRLGENARARSEFEKAILIEPRNLNAAIHLSNMLSSQGDHASAQAILEKASKHNPNDPILRNNLATLYSIKGNYHEAINNFQRALGAAPDMASAHYGLGLAHYNLKEYSQSIGEFKRALQLNPQLIDAHNKVESATRRIGLAHSGRSG